MIALQPHRRGPSAGTRLRSQRGVVLFTALILLVILTLTGVMLTRMQTVEERISANDQDHELAVEAAEATLRFAEVGLYNGTYTGFALNTGGLYTWESGLPDAYVADNPFGPAAPAGALLNYGGPGLPVFATPQFLIESLPTATLPGFSAAVTGYSQPVAPISVYRITAYSYGGDQTTTAELQEIDWEQ